MYTGLVHTHSLLRYFVLIALIVVIVKALIGLMTKRPFGKWDNKFSLYLLIFTHLQLVIGLVLYFVSDKVQFGSETMKNAGLRYWAVEHITAMLVAVVLITVARISMKRLPIDAAKHRRLFIFNSAALLLFISMLWHGGIKIF